MEISQSGQELGKPPLSTGQRLAHPAQDDLVDAARGGGVARRLDEDVLVDLETFNWFYSFSSFEGGLLTSCTKTEMAAVSVHG